MVSLLESRFKSQLAPILNHVLWLPANAPRQSMIVSQGGYKGGGSSKDGKVFSTGFPLWFQIKYIMISSTTATPNVKVDM